MTLAKIDPAPPWHKSKNEPKKGVPQSISNTDRGHFVWEVLHFLTCAKEGRGQFSQGSKWPRSAFQIDPGSPFLGFDAGRHAKRRDTEKSHKVRCQNEAQDGQDEAQDGRESTKSRDCVGRLKNQGNVPQGWGAGGT